MKEKDKGIERWRKGEMEERKHGGMEEGRKEGGTEM